MLGSSYKRVRIGLWVALALLMAGFARADDAPKNLEELKAKYKAETEAIQIKVEKLGEAERQPLVDDQCSRMKATARQAFAYAKAHPDAPDSLDAIVWTVQRVSNGSVAPFAEEITEAYRLLLERGLDDDKVAPVAYYADGVAAQCPAAKRFLEAALAGSKSRVVRGAAGLGLARSDDLLAQSARDVRDPIVGPEYAALWSKHRPDWLLLIRATDVDAAERRAEAMFERVVAEFPDVHLPQPYRQEPFAELAKGELYVLRHLAVGRVAPDLSGEDVRGGPIRLSDHRGKVVAVVFWATWCGPCMGEVPNERKLVAKMAGRPFTLIGIDGDDDREAAKKAMIRESMTWPSVWNGGMSGGIVADWGVRAWPTVYVLDGHGVIRYQALHGEMLGRAVEHLVAEVEADTKSKINKSANQSP